MTFESEVLYTKLAVLNGLVFQSENQIYTVKTVDIVSTEA